MENARNNVKNAILDFASGISATTIAEIMAKITNHTIHLIHLEDKNKMANLDLGKVVRAIGAGNILKTCEPYDDSCEFFYYDENTGVARTAWEAVEFIDNAEAFCFYVGHHKELMKRMNLPHELYVATTKYFGEGTTYTPPKYEKVDFSYFEKVGRYYGLNDKGIAHAKKLATMNFDYYKTISNENIRVLSIIANMRAISNALELHVDESYHEMDWEVDFHENGSFTWYYKGVPIDID